MHTTITTLKTQGYRCRIETIGGQGHLGGDGITCYRVRDPRGNLAMYAISTHRTARAAWAEAATYIAQRS